MRQIIVSEFVSLDGVVDSPGGEPGYRHSGWTFNAVPFDPAAYEIKGREQQEASALLLGRVSYEAFAPIWPTVPDFDDYNAMPRYVVSTTLEHDDPQWPATVLRSLDDVRALRDGEGGPIIIAGSAALVRSLQDADLVDRYHLLVFPVLLGSGRRMFSDTERDLTRFEVVETERYGNGIQLQVLDVVR